MTVKYHLDIADPYPDSRIKRERPATTCSIRTTAAGREEKLFDFSDAWFF